MAFKTTHVEEQNVMKFDWEVAAPVEAKKEETRIARIHKVIDKLS